MLQVFFNFCAELFSWMSALDAFRVAWLMFIFGLSFDAASFKQSVGCCSGMWCGVACWVGWHLVWLFFVVLRVIQVWDVVWGQVVAHFFSMIIWLCEMLRPVWLMVSAKLSWGELMRDCVFVAFCCGLRCCFGRWACHGARCDGVFLLIVWLCCGGVGLMVFNLSNCCIFVFQCCVLPMERVVLLSEVGSHFAL